MEKNTNIAVFEGQQIRHSAFEGEVYYNLVDVMTVLDASTDPAKYWFKVKKKMLDTVPGFSLVRTRLIIAKEITIIGN